MGKKLRYIIPVVLAICLVAVGVLYVAHHNNGWLNPAGPVASHERHLLVMVTLLMLPIVLPVFFLTFFIAWKYRASNIKATYSPEWDHSRRLETIWWGFPCLIIFILAIFAWNSSHSLDPARPIASRIPIMTIQVVALQWKWLFIYPQQQIATVNYVQFPVGTPINFEITADAPMNSFWIPRLGSQIYAMAGMTTHLNLLADQVGNFRGSSANISGAGFASMQFIAHASTNQDFSSWVKSVKTTPQYLGLAAYTALAQPTIPKTTLQYASFEPNLYDNVIMKYMSPAAGAMTGVAATTSQTHMNMQGTAE